jgi:hypothetical protein
MQRTWNRLKAQVEEHPLETAVVLTALLTATAKVMQANTERKNSKTWAREVERRRMMA